MKNIYRLSVAAALAIVLSACNNVAEFKTTNFVSFNTTKAIIPEAVGIYTVPVALYHAQECAVTYKVVDGSAKRGVDYEVVDESGNPYMGGVLNITSSKGSIYLKITDRTGELTKNLSFKLELMASVTEGVNLGATTTLNCTILDADAGVNLLVGSWKGEGEDTSGDPTDITFDLSILDPDAEGSADILEKYPDCNLVFSNLTLPANGMDSKNDIYGYFDDNTSKVHIYGLQTFNKYNFSGLGAYYVGLGTGNWPQNGDDIILTADDDKMVSDGEIVVWIIGEDGKTLPEGYYAGDFASGFEFTKID